MNYGIALTAIVAIRKEPAEQSEMTSQLLFGEMYRVLSEQERWIRITTCYDKYEGWISKEQHHEMDETEYRQLTLPVRMVLPVKYAEAIPENEIPFTIVAGSDLTGYNKETQNIRIGNLTYRITGYSGEEYPGSKESILKTAKQFLNTAYLWGGRSLFGCDCSGFVQTVFKINNVFLPRDAIQQSKCGTVINSLDKAEPCDLVFFKNEKQNVHHVGILISPAEIIHSSGCVRIDAVDKKGIFNITVQRYTHTSLFIRRILPKEI